MPPTAAPEQPTYRTIEIGGLAPDRLAQLSEDMKLSLSREDMLAVQALYSEWKREPTDVELEVIAQTWSEHCKHRIFGAEIEHSVNGQAEKVDGLFKTYIKRTTETIMERKPGFVLSCFHDNAGFIKLDDKLAVCLKAETHNHPSAIEPYAGANTGLGGVIRDILGAGKGAKPIASLDVFCFGPPDTDGDKIKANDVIHPLGIMRGVVRGVRDYGNRMGIPTVCGAIQYDETYIYNPLVFCGTAGSIPIPDIDKEMEPHLQVIAVGGRTGRDGLHGATFSSASLTTDSHEEDQQAVQIGDPITEKKVNDFMLEARDRGLIVFVTDCGAGGFSSAAGEMLSETGGELFLERAPLKEPGMVSWEIFLSESQERMVLAVREESLPELRELADIYETELTVLGHSDDSGILKVWHNGELVVELDCSKLHEAPRRHLRSQWTSPEFNDNPDLDASTATEDLRKVLADFAVVSREPIIREYDHEVQGNTVLKPLAGATGDAPQDGSVVRIDGSERLMAMSLSILPEWGKTDPFAMGQACVDETVRQLTAMGADPDRIGILDNFCMGNPDDETELGALVETNKGMAEVALAYDAPFISGKDSFYNYFETDEGPVSVPVTLLVSGIGIVDDPAHVTGSSLRSGDSVLVLLGNADASGLGASVYARAIGLPGARVPACDSLSNLDLYRRLHKAIKSGLVRSIHDISEGGLATAAAEMGFSMKGGIELDLPETDGKPHVVERLFTEAPGRFLVELDPASLASFQSQFEGGTCTVIGKSTTSHARLDIRAGETTLINDELASLKSIWKDGLTPYY